jgi:hypothetical protein
MKCSECDNEFPDERHDLLGVATCISCTPQAPKPLGVMIYDHKSGGVMETIDDPELFKQFKTSNDEMLESL